MIFHVAQHFQHFYTFLNVFHYVSVRSACSFLSALLFSFLFGEWFIEQSRRRFQSGVREHVPEGHQIKNSTPTMGGLFILSIVTLNVLLWANLSVPLVWVFLLCLLGFGLVGFCDDWAKITKKKGVLAGVKFKLQIIVALLVALIWYYWAQPNTELCVPFIKSFMPIMGLLLIPWAAFVLIAMSNAVNLTDGLDGLATGPLIFNISAFSLICYLASHKAFALYLYIPHVQASELVVCGTTLIGALLGFLWYNSYPAQIFMGDVGSLALGAALGFMALAARQELLLPLAGGIFFLETLSVIIQVISFKLTGKRVFKMAPIHHHFELLGWSEPKITTRFWIISIILSVLAVLTLKIR